MSTNSERILGPLGTHSVVPRPLLYCAATRALEASAAATLPAHALMERAGLALAKLVMAVAPHAKTIWVACGPGNNGGDGFEAAWHLKQWGKEPVVTSLASASLPPADALAARHKALQAQVRLVDEAPPAHDACIDALFGIGPLRPLDSACSALIARMNAGAAPVISADLPSGLDADTGASGAVYVRADYTLCLLSLKPGLFTGNGRDACGEIWFDALGVPAPSGACAQLNPAPAAAVRAHNTHKGTYGDVGVVGGAQGMAGAALLAATAALRGGAGRTYLALLDPAPLHVDPHQPELMFRALDDLHVKTMTVVAGCGGGTRILAHLPSLITHADRLVLDADALNGIASHPELVHLVVGRKPQTTVLTPHPLEAARLLGISVAQVQADRLGAAQALADRFACTVVLKGSGTVIAAPHTRTNINPTGNARLATAGTGDVLAGLIGARMASGQDSFLAACDAVFLHGQVADRWNASGSLSALALAQAL